MLFDFIAAAMMMDVGGERCLHWFTVLNDGLVGKSLRRPRMREHLWPRSDAFLASRLYFEEFAHAFWLSHPEHPEHGAFVAGEEVEVEVGVGVRVRGGGGFGFEGVENFCVCSIV